MKTFRNIFVVIICLLIANPAIPCTRVLWDGNKKDVIVGRNMDWLEDTRSNLWLFPRGIDRAGATSGETAKWTSKYGSVILSMYDIGTVDGLNEKGLTANLLYLTESKLPIRNEKIPGISVSQWAQFYLDNFETVAEAVTYTEKNAFQIANASVITAMGQKDGTVHLAISDKTGDSAVLEYISGDLKIYHDPAYKVMTNSPPFDKQIASLRQYEGFGGSKKLPGTTEAADRFVRAAFYSQSLPQTTDYREAIAGVLSVMRNTSQPFGEPNPARPYISTTRWRTVADLTRKMYFYENTLSPNIVWIDFSKLNFTKGQPIKKIGLVKNYDLIGDVSKKFEATKPFEFLKGEEAPDRKAQLERNFAITKQSK